MRSGLLLSLITVACGMGAAEARNFLATGAQCRAQGGVPDSAVTSRQDPDPVRNCYVRDAAPPSVSSSQRRGYAAPSVAAPSGGGAAGVLGGIAGVLGAGAALIDALPSNEDAPPADPEPQPETPAPVLAKPPRAPRPARTEPSSPQRLAADQKMEECRAMLAQRRNVEARQCFLEAKAMYDEAVAAEEAAAARRPVRASHRNSGRTKGKVPEGCLVVGQAYPAGVGCGGGREWYWTPVSIKKGAHCPRDFNIRYFDPGDGQVKQGEEFPGRLQTCGDGVTRAWIDQ